VVRQSVANARTHAMADPTARPYIVPRATAVSAANAQCSCRFAVSKMRNFRAEIRSFSIGEAQPLFQSRLLRAWGGQKLCAPYTLHATPRTASIHTLITINV